MLIRLVFVVAETFGTWRSARDWAGYAAQVALTSFVVSVMCGLVETASGLGGDVGASLRSFTTPGVLAAAVCAAVVTGSSARSAHAALRDGRTVWAASGVGRPLARVVVLAQTITVSSVSTVLGLAGAHAAITGVGTLVLGTTEIPLRFGAPTWVAASVIVGATLVPSAVDAIRRPVEAGPSSGRPSRTVALSVAAMTWTGTAAWLALVPVSSVRALEQRIALSIVSLALAVIVTSTVVNTLRSRIASALSRPDTVGTGLVWVLGLGSAAGALRASTAALGPILASVSLTGGAVAVFTLGDIASARLTGAGETSTVNVDSILLTLTPVLLLAVGASIIASATGDPRRRTATRVLLAARVPLRTLVAAAALGAATSAVLAASLSLAVVLAACTPIVIAAGLDVRALVSAVCNPVEAGLLLLMGALLVIAAAVRTAAAGVHVPARG